MFWGDKTQLSVQEYLHWASTLHPKLLPPRALRDGKNKYMSWDGPELAQRPLGEKEGMTGTSSEHVEWGH